MFHLGARRRSTAELRKGKQWQQALQLLRDLEVAFQPDSRTKTGSLVTPAARLPCFDFFGHGPLLIARLLCSAP